MQNYPCVQKLGTDNRAAGKTAGEQVLAALEAKGVKEGKIGIVSVNAATTSTVDRDEGFRSAFEGTLLRSLKHSMQMAMQQNLKMQQLTLFPRVV